MTRSATMTVRQATRAAVARINADELPTAVGYLVSVMRLRCDACEVVLTMPTRGEIADYRTAYATHELSCPRA